MNRCIPSINTRAVLHQFKHHSFFLSASGGAGGVRTVITRQHELILRAVYPHADVELRAVLTEQLVTLLDSLLSGYVAQLTSLHRSTQQERYVTLENEYTQKRSELLAPLCECFVIGPFYVVLSVWSDKLQIGADYVFNIVVLSVICGSGVGSASVGCGAGGEIL